MFSCCVAECAWTCFPPQLPNKLHAQGPAVKKRRTGEFATSLDACLMCNSPGQRILSFVFASFELTDIPQPQHGFTFIL